VRTIILRRSSALVAAAVFCLAPAARSAPQLTVDQAVTRNLNAKGGLERLRAVQSIKQTASLSMMGMEATMTLYSKRPNLVRQEITVNKQLVINAFDGEVPWLINPMMGASRPIIVSGPQAESIKEQSGFDGPLVDFKARGVVVSVEGLESAGDQTLVHLKLVSPKSLQIRHLYLDSVTYLDAKLTTEQDKVKLDQEFLDYREVEGIKVPFLIRSSANGVVQSEIKVQKVEFNAKMDDTLFRMPKGS
jgi:hypothetical protein